MYQFDYKTFKQLNPFVKNKDIAEYLEVSEGYVSKVISGQTQLSEEKFRKLIGHPTWNIGPLLGRAQAEQPTYEHPLNIAPIPMEGSLPNRAQSGNIPAWLPTAPKGADDVETIEVEEVPFISKPVIESREMDIREYIESGDVKKIIPQGLVQEGASYARKIYSDAMAPDIREGDIILCSFVPDTSNLVDGDIYAVDTTRYGCVIRDIRHDGEEIILMARNPKFPNLRVKQSEITSVAVPMQLIRSTFSQRTDYAKIIREKDERIDLLVSREKSYLNQVERLIENSEKSLGQIDKMTSQQGRLIEMLENERKK